MTNINTVQRSNLNLICLTLLQGKTKIIFTGVLLVMYALGGNGGTADYDLNDLTVYCLMFTPMGRAPLGNR